MPDERKKSILDSWFEHSNRHSVATPLLFAAEVSGSRLR